MDQSFDENEAADHLPEELRVQSGSDVELQPSRDAKRLSLFAWDGILPLVVLSAPAFLRFCFPGKHDVTDVIAVVLVPIAASLVRASMGWRRLCELFFGRAPVVRQLLLALAIIVLMIFEFYAGAVYCSAGPVPQDVYIQVLVMYCFYLTLIVLALRRPSKR